MKEISAADLRLTFSQKEPPSGISPQLAALWYAGKGDWDKAHQIVQDLNDKSSAKIHAFLHRQEGDLSNANYWYNRAGTEMPAVSIDEEWELLITGND